MVVEAKAVALAIRRRDAHRQNRGVLGKGEIHDVVDDDLVPGRKLSEPGNGAEVLFLLFALSVGLGILSPGLILRLVVLHLIHLVGEPATVVGERERLDLIDPSLLTTAETDDGQTLSRLVFVVVFVLLVTTGFFALTQRRRDRRHDPTTVTRNLGF